jgi:PIN domain nuclease of toxin-antitoxin system
MRRFLPDTRAFLWWVDDAPELTAAARQVIADANSKCYLSLTSCWEMAIKVGLGKLQLSKSVERFVLEQLTANGFALLKIELHHVASVAKLPYHHRDPFDRLLIAQAILEKLTLLSADSVFSEYGVKVIW